MTSGILNVNKPGGITSFAVVSRVRRLTGVRKVGHAGTLDPVADGVLPICLGSATRVVEHIVSAPKLYRATIRLGVETDSYDSDGTVVATADPSGVTANQVEAALRGYVGEIQQLPPMYSAVKHEGRPLYSYARAGRTAPRKERTVMVYALRVLGFESPLVEVEMEVGRGAYVRAIAHDLGEKLGCHAHLQRLTRERSGPFSLGDAITLDQLNEAAMEARWEELLWPLDRPLESWHAALLGKEHTRDVHRGRLVVLTPVRTELRGLELETPCRAYSDDGEFLAVLRYRGADRWHPDKVFVAR